MGFKAYLIFLNTIFVSIYFSHGCEMENVGSWMVPQPLSITDVFSGELFASSTSSIAGINSITVFQTLNRGPYFIFEYTDSWFTIRTNDSFVDYEEYEIETTLSITTVFNCVGGTIRSMVFLIDIIDTNNHDPLFRPSTELEFIVMPPLPPGFEINSCLQRIYARDVDLTTQRVDFEVYDSPYFEIDYDAESSTTPKEFNAILRTTTFIRSIPEPLVFRISATDVDLTNDPRRTTFATVTIISNGEFELPEELVFSQTFYLATYTEDHQVILQDTISLRQGYHEEVQFSLGQEYQQYFTIVRNTNQIYISVFNQLPADLLTRQQILLVVYAERNNTSGASATVVLQLPEAEALMFQQQNYEGTIEDNVLQLSELILTQGYSGETISVDIISDHASYFSYTIQENRITLSMTPLPSTVLEQNNFLNLQVVAYTNLTTVSTIVTLDIVKDDSLTPVFQRALYEGTYDLQNSLTLEQIVMVQGYDNSVQIALRGDHEALFQLVPNGPNFNLNVTSIPTELFGEGRILLTLEASKPRTVGANTAISISLPAVVSSVYFEKVLYEGILQSSVVQHETITVTGFEGTTIDLIGEYSSLFTTSLSNGLVEVQATGSLTLPADIRHVVLELRAGDSGAVLVLEILSTDGPVLPTVSFEASSYALRVEIGQTGLVGQVGAFADNGEAVTYSLTVDNEHLRGRISINTIGELRLSAPANSGIYNFQAVATSVFSQVAAYTTIHLSVESLVICGNETVTAPLIVLNRDEEEPLRDLVLLNPTEHAGCRYTLTSRWPTDQNWFYVDETGVHAFAIDREDPSIAFMALSQVQVELILTCDSDAIRTKRSTNERLESLGPYDYGTSTWLLGETISFNSRRSIVNLIVNDINDNIPIFVGKENEPIVVGYPVPELKETVLPRSLAELQATDADVGINAALVYWSSEPQLAVSPTTGFVHVNNDQSLEQDMILTVNATDLNGQGHTGSISLMVKLLDSSNIAVITVRDAFLEDESFILGNLSNVVGYEVRALRSVVVSEAEDAASTRMKRDVMSTGASLEIYVYGLVQREPISVDALTTDINNAAVVAVNIARILSLQDHLDGRLICDNPERDTGLLVATIVLSILLFLLIVAIIVWFVLRWLKKRNYKRFSDSSSGRNSLVSQKETPAQLPKPLDGLAVTKPRLNIEELKKSEKRLQDMLNAPVEPVFIEPTTSNELNSVTKIAQPDPLAPIVIQDKLKDATDESDDDEFGERNKRRKSVVTFNENVEKIIPVDDEPDPDATSDEPTFEVYRM